MPGLPMVGENMRSEEYGVAEGEYELKGESIEPPPWKGVPTPGEAPPAGE